MGLRDNQSIHHDLCDTPRSTLQAFMFLDGCWYRNTRYVREEITYEGGFKKHKLKQCPFKSFTFE